MRQKEAGVSQLSKRCGKAIKTIPFHVIGNPSELIAAASVLCQNLSWL